MSNYNYICSLLITGVKLNINISLDYKNNSMHQKYLFDKKNIGTSQIWFPTIEALIGKNTTITEKHCINQNN